MKLNLLKLNFGRAMVALTAPRTFEGAPAAGLTPEQSLRRSVLACMLWESEFYESGETIATRIRELVPRVAPETVAALAVEARTRMKLRHAPLLLVREMARHATHRGLVAETLPRVIQRADELAEFVAIYWATDDRGVVNVVREGNASSVLPKRAPLSAAVKKGLAAAFTRFDEYALAKYDRANAEVKLRDVLFLTHAKPLSAEMAALWKRLVAGELAVPDTWEVALSAAGQGVADPAQKLGAKREVWTRLLTERKLGALALLRNLRNLREAGVDEALVERGLDNLRTDRVLPFRFLAAARYAPRMEGPLERAMLRALAAVPAAERLPGRTVLLVDVSGSMTAQLSARSEMLRTDAAFGLAVLLREIAQKVVVYSFSNDAVEVRSPFGDTLRGFALRNAIDRSQGHGGTYLGKALETVRRNERYGWDRLIVLTDEQSHDRVDAPAHGRGYVINVASARHGVGYGGWVHIDGWSEATVEYIRELERAA